MQLRVWWFEVLGLRCIASAFRSRRLRAWRVTWRFMGSYKWGYKQGNYILTTTYL